MVVDVDGEKIKEEIAGTEVRIPASRYKCVITFSWSLIVYYSQFNR